MNSFKKPSLEVVALDKDLIATSGGCVGADTTPVCTCQECNDVCTNKEIW